MTFYFHILYMFNKFQYRIDAYKYILKPIKQIKNISDNNKNQQKI